MSGTVMKFGPQWIRTLTDGAAPTANNTNNNNNAPNNNSTSTSSASSSAASNHHNHNNNNTSPSFSNNPSSSSNVDQTGGVSSAFSKYKLAEYRYGREEMLALYEPSPETLDDIRKFADLFVEKARAPMAMTPMSEEELKQSTRSWNSDAVLRSSKHAATVAAGSGLSQASGGHLNSNLNDRDSRQNSDRGTLTAAEVLSSSPRGPPGSLTRAPLSEQRGLLGSLSSRGHPSSIRNLVGRGTSLYTRSQSHDDEGNGGDAVAGGLTGSSGLGGAAAAGGGAFENRFGSSGQARQPNSLRARFENNRANASSLGGGVLTNASKPIDIKPGIDGEALGERRSVFDRLPSKYSSDNDKLSRKDINGRPLQTDWRSRESWSTNGPGGSTNGPDGSRVASKAGMPSTSLEERQSWRSSRIGAAGGGAADDWRSGNSANAAPSSSWYVRTDDQRNNLSRQTHQPQNQENLNQSFSGKRDTTRRPSGDEKHDDDIGNVGGHGMNSLHQSRHRRDSLPEWSIGDPLSGDKVGSFDASGAFREISRDDGNSSNASNTNIMGKQQKQHQLHRIEQHQQQHQQQQNHNQNQQKQDPQSHGSDFDHLERAAEIMVEKWTADEDNDRDSSPSHDFLGNSLSNNKPNLHNRDQQHDKKQQQQQQQQHQQATMLQNNVANNRLAANQHRQQQHQERIQLQVNKEQHQIADPTANNQQKLVLLPFNHEDSQQWFYRDTQGVIQGPFSASEMFEWYKAGYFVKELLVRRACDELFYPLGEVIKMWDRIPFAPLPMNIPPPPPITTQTILQFRAVTKQLEMAASQGRIPPNAFADIAHQGTVLLHGPLALQQQQQQQVHPVLAAASLNQNATAPPDQQANIRQIIEAATRQQQQHDPTSLVQHQQHQQQQRNLPVNVLDQNEMQTQLRQLLAQLKNREGFSNLNAQEQQEVLVRQFVASRSVIPQSANASAANAGSNNVAANLHADQDQQAAALMHQRARMMPFLPAFLSNDQQERLRYQQELERRQKDEAEKQQQQSRLIMEQRMKAEEEKQRLIEEVQKQRQMKQMEENEKLKQEAEKERLLKLSQLKQQQLAQQQEEFKQQLQNQQRIQQHQQQEKKQQQQQSKQQQVVQLNTIQQQQQQQIERAKKAAQAQQLQQEQQQQQNRKTAWSTISKPDRDPIPLATLQKLQEEEKERERERLRQQQIQSNQLQQQQQQSLQHAAQRQLTWANAAQQSKAAPVKTLAEIQKEEEERLAREKQRKAKIQPTVASASVWNNAASHLTWKNPPADS